MLHPAAAGALSMSSSAAAVVQVALSDPGPLQIAPGITPTLLERIIYGREDMKNFRSEVRGCSPLAELLFEAQQLAEQHCLQVTAACKETYSTQRGYMGEETPVVLAPRGKAPGTPGAPGTPTDKENARFQAALLAVKRKGLAS